MKTQPTPGPYTLGNAETHGTYHANTLYLDGEPIAQFSGLPINTTVQEMEAGEGLLKIWKEDWARAKRVVSTLNAAPKAIAALERAEKILLSSVHVGVWKTVRAALAELKGE